MIEPNAVRPPREVAIADHLWSAFEEMAEVMGADRDGLINQAMFMFARLNGFMEATRAGAPVRSGPPVLQPVASTTQLHGRGQTTQLGLEGSDRKQVAERVLETAAELERLIKGKPAGEDDQDYGYDDQDLPQDDLPPEDDGYYDEPPADPQANDFGDDAPYEGALYLVTENGESEQIVKDRFVIGRGKHCDMVINSGKVSREHAVITHEGDDFFIEDLGSSNGTWFNKQRIKRRKIEDGDEYFICSEKVQLVLR